MVTVDVTATSPSHAMTEADASPGGAPVGAGRASCRDGGVLHDPPLIPSPSIDRASARRENDGFTRRERSERRGNVVLRFLR